MAGFSFGKSAIYLCYVNIKPKILTLFIPRGPLFWAKNLQEQTSLFLVKTTNNVFLQPPLTDNPVSEHYFETSQGVNNLCIVAMSPTG